MTARHPDLVRAIRQAGAGFESYPVQRTARQAYAAELFATTAGDDAGIAAGAERALQLACDLATLPSADASGLAQKLATVLRLRLGAMDANACLAESAELQLLASALGDCVILADRPLANARTADRQEARVPPPASAWRQGDKLRVLGRARHQGEA